LARLTKVSSTAISPGAYRSMISPTPCSTLSRRCGISPSDTSMRPLAMWREAWPVLSITPNPV
jgi:hypothetical protein